MDKELFETIKAVVGGCVHSGGVRFSADYDNGQLTMYLPNMGQSAEGAIHALAALRDHIDFNIDGLHCSNVYASGKRFYVLIERN